MNRYSRESNVGSLKSGSIVSTVTGNSDNLSHALEVLDENLLVLGRGTSEDLKAGNDFVALSDGELAEDGSLHDDTTLSEDATL